MGHGGFKQYRRLRTVIGVLLFAGFVFGGTAAAGAEDDPPIIIDDKDVIITIVEAESITSGGSAPRHKPNWPYKCIWVQHSYFPDPNNSGGSTVPVEGVLYWLFCAPTDPALDRITLLLVYDPADPVPGFFVTTSLDIRTVARQVVTPTVLEVGHSPDGDQITGVETWLWPDGSTADVIGSAVGGISGLTVWVEARWTHTEFDVDEPGVPTIVCTAVTEWSPGEDDTDCSHTYLTESAGRTITATSYWDIYWWDNANSTAPRFWETVSLVNADVVDVLDLEAVIAARSAR